MRRDRRRDLIDDRVRIEHMLHAARDARQYIAGRKNIDLETDSMLRRAVANAVQEVGEAAANVSDAGRARVAELPWGQIVAMRHIIVHFYWGVDTSRLWKTATDDVPLLIDILERACVGWPLPPEA